MKILLCKVMVAIRDKFYVYKGSVQECTGGTVQVCTGDCTGDMSGAQVCAGVYRGTMLMRHKVHRCMQVCTGGLCM